MVNCPNCEAENGENIKFCTECGTKIEIADLKHENVNENICPDCSAELPVNTRFCTDCGAKIEQIPIYDTKKQINCPKCSTEILAGTKFCTDCGTKIEQTIYLDPNQEIDCPKCSKKLPGNSKFCKECGTKIRPVVSNQTSYNELVSDETIESVKETGKDIMKEAGSLFKKFR
jgi:DNA-directed RNA polymerase subunit RPC12/RpoP